jgi:hypothetical protein
VVGLRTDGDVGKRGAELAESIDRQAPSGTTAPTDGSDSGEPRSTLASTTTAVPTVDDPDDVPESLRLAQLTDADLPDGWAAGEHTDRTTAVCPGQDPGLEVDADSSLKTSFVRADSSITLTSTVAEFDGDDEAESYLDALAGALDACDGYEDDGTGLSYSVERTRGSDLGDESLTASMTLDGTGVELRVRLLGVRVGDRVVVIAFSSIGESDASVAVEALEKVVARL